MIPRVPDELLQSDLPDTAVRVWITIRKVQGENPCAYGGQDYYAERSGKHRSTVNRAIKLLKEKGWIVQNGGRKLTCVIPSQCDDLLQNCSTVAHSKSDDLLHNCDDLLHKSDDALQPSESLQLIQSVNPLNPLPPFDPVREYQDAYGGRKIDIYQSELLTAKCTDADTFRENLTFWRGNKYQFKSVARFIQRYDELVRQRDAELLGDVQRNGKLPGGAARGTVQGVRAGQTGRPKRDGELSREEYLERAGWTPEKIAKFNATGTDSGDGTHQIESNQKRLR